MPGVVPICPSCSEPIAAETIDLARNAAKCRACGIEGQCEAVFTASLRHATASRIPPDGSWRKQRHDCVIIGARSGTMHRALYYAMGTAWAASMGGMFLMAGRIAIDPLSVTIAVAVLMWLGQCTLKALLATDEARIDNDELVVSTGAWPFRARSRLRLDAITAIGIDQEISTFESGWRIERFVLIKADRNIKFCVHVSAERRAYIEAALFEEVRRRRPGSALQAISSPHVQDRDPDAKHDQPIPHPP